MTQNGLKTDYIRIGLASPSCIKKWATRILPNGKKIGKITNSKTVNYKTFKPESGGLFCEKIFGPVNDFECLCGRKVTKPKLNHRFCPTCDVEFTKSQVRRYRLGYIKLAFPVAHIWYLKGRPRYLSLLLDRSQKFTKKLERKKVIESVVYYNETIHLLVQKYVQNKKVSVHDFPYSPDKLELHSINFLKESKGTKGSHEIITNNTSVLQPFHNVKNNPENFLIYEYYFHKLKKKISKYTIFKTQLIPLFYKFSYLNTMKFYFLECSEFPLTSLNSVSILNKKRKNENFSTENIKQVAKFKLPLALQGKGTKKIFLNKTVNTVIKRTFSNEKLKTNNILASTQLKFNKKHVDSNFSQPRIYPCYPLCFHYLIFSENSRELELKNDWNKLTEYLIPDQNKLDSKIPLYSYRFLPESIIINKNQYQYKQFFLTGTKAIRHLLKTLDIQSTREKLKSEIKPLDVLIEPLKDKAFLSKFEKKKLRKFLKWRLYNVRCLKILSHFKQNSWQLRPEWMILSVLPVLPPDLRPLVKIGGDRPFTSDLIPLYQSILNRNKRVSTYHLENYPVERTYTIYKFNLRLLQEAVDALIENGKGGTPVASGMNGSPYKSLSDALKGKKGRFRNNLLGKRVDYSGRSVIVVAPELKLHECGLPKEMAIELFQPFIIRELRQKFNKTIIAAKTLIYNQDPIIWKIVQKILKAHPVLLNRAPTLHRLGIQAFQAKLVNGQAILLHPLVCPAFNADFDGDQMAVHVPLSFQARAEAWQLMWSRNNLLSPATGQPIIVPTQDMILGCYYLTTTTLTSPCFVAKQPFGSEATYRVASLQKENGSSKSLKSFQNSSNQSRELKTFSYFSNLNEVLIAFYQKKILLHSFIWVRYRNQLQIENFYEEPFEIKLDCYGNTVEIYSQYWRNSDDQYNQISQFIRTTTGRVLLNKIILENVAKIIT